jgi:hypothetical protein
MLTRRHRTVPEKPMTDILALLQTILLERQHSREEHPHGYLSG